MAIPEKREDLVALGWVYDNDAVCRGCGAPVEWWVTRNGKKMPMRVFALDQKGDVVLPGSLTRPVAFVRRSHFADCPEAKGFRRKE